MLSIIKNKKNQNLLTFFAFLLVSFLVLYFTTKSSPFFKLNEWSDPNTYMSMARGWLAGKMPYRDMFDHKGPILFIIYGIGYLISENSFTGVYIVQSIFFAVTLFFIFKISNIFTSYKFAILVPILFIPVFFRFSLSGSAEEFIQTFQSIFLYIIIRTFTNTTKSRESLFMFIAGVLVGILMLIKFNIIAFCFCFLAAIILKEVINKNIKLALKITIYIVLGIISIIIPFIIYFYWTDSLKSFYETYIIFNKTYGNVSLNQLIKNLSKINPKFFLTNLLIVTGIIYLSVSKTYFNNIIYRISFSCTLILTVLSIYCTHCVYDYSYLTLTILIIFSFISIFNFLKNKNFKVKYYLLSIVCISFATVSTLVDKRKVISSRNKYYFIKDFGEYINNNCTLDKHDIRILQMSLDRGLLFFTQTIPHYQYFYHPNIFDSEYPYIYASYFEYLNSETPPHYIYYTKFVQINKVYHNQFYDDFEKLLSSKYTLVQEYTDYSIWPTNNEYLFELKAK